MMKNNYNAIDLSFRETNEIFPLNCVVRWKDIRGVIHYGKVNSYILDWPLPNVPDFDLVVDDFNSGKSFQLKWKAYLEVELIN